MASKDKNRDNPEKRIKWYQKLRDKYRLIILNEDTFEEKLTFRLSRMNVFVVTGMLAIIFIFLTTYLIAFTPLREYIPGYKDTNVQEDLYELQIKADSLEKAFKSKDLYIANMRRVLLGEPDSTMVSSKDEKDSSVSYNYSDIEIKRSKEDSVLRAEYEKSTQYNLITENRAARNTVNPQIYNFFTPIKGVVTNSFNATTQHYGVDIVAARNEVIKAAYDGTVIFAEWSSTTGHVLAVQHSGNIISVYKHNSVILRKQGAKVKAGESISIIGESGEYSTGPHLHFELWIHGNPVDPEKFIIF